MNTGKERSLTVRIYKYIAGVLQAGYPVAYQGRNAFQFQGVDYPALSVFEMRVLPVSDYTTRLAAFSGYVESLEAGLEISLAQTNEAYRENLTACPIN